MIRWLFFFLGLGLLVLVFHRSSPARIAEDVASSGWVIVPFIALSAAENSLHAVSCRLCIVPEHRAAIGWGRMFLFYHLAFAINLVTPTGDVGGDIARGVAMSRHVPPAVAASSILVNKVTFSLARMFLASALAGWAIVALPMDPRSTWIIAGGSAAIFLGLVLFGVFQARGWLGPILVRVARLGGPKKAEWMRDHARELDLSLGSFYRDHRGDLARSVGYDVLGFGVGVVQRTLLLGALLGMHALPFHRLVQAGAGIWGIMNLVDMIFFFVLGRLGVREGGYEASFVAVGLPGEKGLAMSVVDRVDQLFWTLLGLGVYWAYTLRPAPPPPPPPLVAASERTPR